METEMTNLGKCIIFDIKCPIKNNCELKFNYF